MLEQDAADIDLILSTIAFDDSRMVDFLQAVKADAEFSHIPFLCARVLPSILADHLVAHMRRVCTELGAVDLIDVANLPAKKRTAFSELRWTLAWRSTNADVPLRIGAGGAAVASLWLRWPRAFGAGLQSFT